MKGSIRLGIGFMIVFGAVGGMEHNPESSLFVLIPLACVGLLAMLSGVRAMNNE